MKYGDVKIGQLFMREKYVIASVAWQSVIYLHRSG